MDYDGLREDAIKSLRVEYEPYLSDVLKWMWVNRLEQDLDAIGWDEAIREATEAVRNKYEPEEEAIDAEMENLYDGSFSADEDYG